MDNKYILEIIKFQQDKTDQLKAIDGWLSLVGLHWLQEGEQTIGSSLSCDIILPLGKSADIVSTLTLSKGEVSLSKPDILTRVDGAKPIQSLILKPDISSEPSIVQSGEISFYIIVRDELVGIRVKQNSNERRLNFQGRQWYPIDSDFRVMAKFNLFDTPKRLMIPNMLGQETERIFNGELVFKLEGNQYTLAGTELPDGSYSIILNDASCKIESYPAGRFLATEVKQEDGSITIDFNKAYNPPCAFSDFATCPLPPRENVLPIAIMAGERYIPFRK